MIRLINFVLLFYRLSELYEKFEYLIPVNYHLPKYMKILDILWFGFYLTKLFTFYK